MNFVKKIGKGKFTPLLNPKTDEYYQLKELVLGIPIELSCSSSIIGAL